ncbi:unnamed protein product [Acanthoscelides obtectus]|uniref:Uncharacterized protein n=1 Tax=Acanthoscelides obtectus TaxID=200917 RepID=A0A9P0KW48_ACAOB|nr:unnamed protein product [Acanthoscelides obtectus]CAK1643427.1 Histidine-rich membrane protein KE4 homolog 2 [Acanthoscelides obtectus]
MSRHRTLFIACLVIFIGSAFFVTAHGHDHSHDEPPSFKYSKQANEKLAQDQHHGHSHSEHDHIGTHGHAHEHHSTSSAAKEIMTLQEIWIHAMASTLLISAAPFFILFFVPVDSTDTEQPLLKVLLAFASGGLLGDAFLHLIPHAAMAIEGEEHSHSHSHSHGGAEPHGPHDMSVGLWVLGGILAFLVVEKGVRILKGNHGHSHQPVKVVQKQVVEKKKVKAKDGDDTIEEVKEEITTEVVKEIKVAGYLNLAADFSHNFTDGLAIGSSYLAGNTIGIVTTITILLHEVPHEIGDFAILLQSGVSRKNAMLLQLTTALGAVAEFSCLHKVPPYPS